MIRELMKCIREFKRPSILSPVLVSLEVVMECLIPLVIAHHAGGQRRKRKLPEPQHGGFGRMHEAGLLSLYTMHKEWGLLSV